ncbi:hypothetical protein [Kordia jejudonensis]|uniref:hypothetical protein n=1 Tax=Kordia jejudonensis TaxID=1348245 RepID=UPI0006294B55|nr:hypothetical protein [Kordia jejudonensis]
MNFNIISYLLYIPIIFFITVKVGWILYKNGEVFLYTILSNETEIVESLNKILLIGYYLINLGAATITIAFWETVTTSFEMINALSNVLGTTILILALMHYNNIFWIKFLNRKKQTIN